MADYVPVNGDGNGQQQPVLPPEHYDVPPQPQSGVVGGEECYQQQEFQPPHSLNMMAGGHTHEETDETMDTQSPPISSECPEQPPLHYDEHKLFVGGLHPATTEQKLRDYFSQFGTLNEVILKADPITGKSRGYAFLIFEEDDAVDKTLAEGPHSIDDKIVDAKKAIPHAIHQQMKLRTKKVFVGGVPTDMPSDTIRKYFEQFGTIEDVALVTQKGESVRRGFCFVTFESEDMADKACNKQFHKLENTEVEVKRATPREPEKRMGPYMGGGGGGMPHFMGRGRGHLVPTPGGRGQYAPYGGHAGYYQYFGPPPPHPYGGGYMGGGAYGGYGGYQGYEQYGRRDDAYNNSRYGPMRSNYGHGHSHSHVHSHHPYSR